MQHKKQGLLFKNLKNKSNILKYINFIYKNYLSQINYDAYVRFFFKNNIYA